jgi:hypothetical protein
MSYKSVVLADGPTVYYDMDAIGDQATDCIKEEVTLLTANELHVGPATVGLEQSMSTCVVNALKFNGSYITGSSGPRGTSGIPGLSLPVITGPCIQSVEFIIRNTDLSANRDVMSFGYNSSVGVYSFTRLGVLTDGTLYWLSPNYLAGTRADIRSNAGVISANVWYHVVMTIGFDVASKVTGSTTKFYVNGVGLNTNVNTSGNQIDDGTGGQNAFLIGGDVYYQGADGAGDTTTLVWKGDIDEVAIYQNGGLSAAQVSAHYAAISSCISTGGSDAWGWHG